MIDLQKILRDAVAELDRETAGKDRASARNFLARLDPDSQEALWFEALAEKYPSRLDAAVAYLRDVKR